ncbi:zymogen granule membrane protein 16-like [Myripristis murdjan]|uniref:zymogen granule membrane protein 16-like n=1 Tax=Myripristis murdjan TaxID=586833 RepID=UPI0011760A7D|nr:zymogen granule membrane protein 16-like [Myripristis murdjan]
MLSYLKLSSLLFMAVMWASCLGRPAAESYSFSGSVGSGSGTSFTSSGTGRITAVRVWEVTGSYITGIQLRYGLIWAQRNGRTYNQAHEIELFDGERIIQVSGKYHQSNYIYQLVFVTSRGRSLTVGQPTQHSFNFYTNNPEAELIILSGRYNGNGITSLGAHWGVMPMNTTEA